jgi:two-component SAPR family response regulator/LysM repeat protein
LNPDPRAGRKRLIGFAGLMLIAGWTLAAAAGPPRLPSEPPRPEDVLAVLSGTSLPADGLVLILADLAWLVWGWTALSLLFELLVLSIEVVARGQAWVGALRRLVDRLSMPLVRRGVAAAFAVQVISRTVTVASAQSLPPQESVVVVDAVSDDDADRAEARATDSASTYLVRPGDTLWSIAETAYGSGAHYRRLVEANLGRQMADGQIFSAAGVIQPGWRLLAPGATWDVENVDGQRWYTVQPGDSLSGIAARMLGDRTRWEELFDLNRGASSDDGRHRLEEPNTIWPGLRLRLPGPPDEAAAPASNDPEPEPTAAELLVASAPIVVADRPHSFEVDPVQPSVAPEPAATEVPSPSPLLRTPHALQPVVLDAADAGQSDPAPAAPPDTPDPLADAEASIPAAPTPAPTPVPVLPLALGGLGLVGVAGLAYGARRLRRLRPLQQQPESDVVVKGGFAEAQLAHDLTRGLHGMGFDEQTAVVAQLEQFLEEYNVKGVAVVAVRHGNSSTSLTLSCGLPDQPLLLDLATAFADRLEADVEACVSPDQDVVLRLTRLRKTRLLPRADNLHTSPCVVPLGLLYDHQKYAGLWGSLGHVLVASLPGHGGDAILTCLVATLTARRSPERLRVWLIAPPRSLPAPVFEMPHVLRVVDPADSDTLRRTVDALRAELDWRATQAEPVPDLLVVISELASLGEQGANLALLAGRAADLGVRMVVASADPQQAIASALTSCFTTRMVMRMDSEETSVALLGVADAAFLGGGGRLLVWLDGREPVEAYGYHVPAEHLERLVKIMCSAYPTPPAPPPPALQPSVPPDEQPPPAASEDPVLRKAEDSQAPGAEDSLPPSGALIDGQSGPASQDFPLAAPAPSVPIQVFCFGAPRVACSGHAVWPHGGRDAKPWELLLFLASQPPEGATRAAVIEAMWPDDEGMADDAAHRFRQLRYRLRRQLQQVPDAPPSDGVCLDRRGFQLDPAIVYSDAHEFLRLVREARVNPDPMAPEVIRRLERARGLYAGDLLDGPDARRYAWVDERDDSGVTLREHFRRMYENASLRLAEAYAATGLVDASIELYHELSELDPGDERLFLALFRLRAKSGDRPGLEAEEQRMRRILRELAEDAEDVRGAEPVEPDSQTMEEYRQLLAGLREHEPEHQREPAVV